jgi:hypothetical protein
LNRLKAEISEIVQKRLKEIWFFKSPY